MRIRSDGARPGRSLITQPLVVVGASLAAIVILGLLLRRETGVSGPAGEEPLIFYCAAGIIKPVQDVAREYQETYGVPIQIEPGGSGKLLSKIRVAKGRGNLYLAAEDWYVDQAKADGLVAESIPVARMHPAIAVAAGNPKNVQSIDDLMRKDVKVSLANPEVASIGRTVREQLSESGRWAPLAARAESAGAELSFVGTVNEAAQSVKIGAADAAIIWDSLARQFGLEVVEDDALRRAEKTITIGVLEPNDRATASLRFARFLTSRDRGLVHFAKYDFLPIEDADLWSEKPELPMMAGAMLKPGIDDAIERFEQREGVEFQVVYNGCGILVAQMKAGAPAEAYFSCDVSFLRDVQDRFDSGIDVSRNPMVLIVPKGNPKGIRRLGDLANADLRVGLAHPKNSALGALTDRLLVKLDLHEKVYGSGARILHSDAGHMLINQIRTGSLDACVVYRSNAMSNPTNVAEHLDIVPIDLPEAVAVQPYAIASASDHKYLMRRFFDAVVAAQTRERFEELGFEWIHEPEQR